MATKRNLRGQLTRTAPSGAVFLCLTAPFHRTRKEKAAREVAEFQAPLLADKATLASETTEELLALESQQHHGDEA
ncbi:hypothetical protein C8C89_0571 [Janthinobacterium sp. 75]|nr:hypothetical protein C8C89_0571 [Janthinobacterium sp. 75]